MYEKTYNKFYENNYYKNLLGLLFNFNDLFSI